MPKVLKNRLLAPLSTLFYVFLLIFRYFIVSLPHHQNDKRYAAKYNRKKARNQLVGELHQLQQA